MILLLGFDLYMCMCICWLRNNNFGKYRERGEGERGREVKGKDGEKRKREFCLDVNSLQVMLQYKPLNQ